MQQAIPGTWVQGAGFYINATQAPWAEHYQMESFIADELYAVVTQNFPLQADAIGIFGHSMGGHGALTLAFKYPEKFKSVSAFAPICAPSQCPWGEKAFSNYLGADQADGKSMMQRLWFSPKVPCLRRL